MALYPDLTPPDPHKDTILGRCPFTSAFLDKSGLLNATNWQKKLQETSDPIHQKFKENLGEDYESKFMIPMSIPLQQSGILNRSFPTQAKIMATQDIISLGYEIGNREDINLLSPDIVKRLIQVGIVDRQLQNIPDSQETIRKFVNGLLSVGLYYRLNWERKDNPPKPTAFDDFIQGLDLPD